MLWMIDPDLGEVNKVVGSLKDLRKLCLDAAFNQSLHQKRGVPKLHGDIQSETRNKILKDDKIGQGTKKSGELIATCATPENRWCHSSWRHRGQSRDSRARGLHAVETPCYLGPP